MREGDGHLDGVLRYVGGAGIVALGDGVGGAPEAHGDGRNTVLVVHGVGLGGEGERLGGLRRYGGARSSISLLPRSPWRGCYEEVRNRLTKQSRLM